VIEMLINIVVDRRFLMLKRL